MLEMDVGGAVRRALTEHGGVPSEVLEYAGDTAAGLVEDMGDEGVDTIASEMEDALGALLEGSMGRPTSLRSASRSLQHSRASVSHLQLAATAVEAEEAVAAALRRPRGICW